MPVYNNLFLGQGVVLDFKMDSFDDSAAMTKRVVQWVCEKFSITPEDLTIVFSGGKGFHDYLVRLEYGRPRASAIPRHLP